MVLEGPFLVVVLLAALAADGARIPHGRPRRAKKAPRPDSRAVLSPAAEAMLSLVAYQKWTVLGASFPAEKQAILQLERKLQSLGLPLGYAIDLQGELLDDLVNHSAAPTFVTSPLLEADPRPPSLVLVDTGHSDATAEAFRDALRTAGFPDAYADAAADYLVDGLVHHDARPRFVTDSALARRRADVWELLAERHFPADLMEAAIEPETGYVPELLAWIESIPPFDVVQPGLDAAVDLLTKQGMTPRHHELHVPAGPGPRRGRDAARSGPRRRRAHVRVHVREVPGSRRVQQPGGRTVRELDRARGGDAVPGRGGEPGAVPGRVVVRPRPTSFASALLRPLREKCPAGRSLRIFAPSRLCGKFMARILEDRVRVG